MAAAGIGAHPAERADTAFARGRKRHAKTDSRQLLAEGRLPECWVPPARVLEARALPEAYNDLRREHTAWVQRIHAVFHQGAADELSGLPRLIGPACERHYPGKVSGSGLRGSR
jgi:transposase